MIAAPVIRPGSRHGRGVSWDAWKAAVPTWPDAALTSAAQRLWKMYGSRSTRAQYNALAEIYVIAAEWTQRHPGDTGTWDAAFRRVVDAEGRERNVAR